MGTRAEIECFTETVFERSPEDTRIRPDGLLLVNFGKRSWSALIEAKIGAAALDQQQVEKYLQLAKSNDLDALITISNQFATTPIHSPVKVAKPLAPCQITHGGDVHNRGLNSRDHIRERRP